MTLDTEATDRFGHSAAVPSSIAINSQGDILVVDPVRKKVSIFG